MVEENKESKPSAINTTMVATAASYSIGTCVEDEETETAYDSILQPTILGYHLINNPYSLSSMRQAYLNLYGNSNGVDITNVYYRFKPSTPQQLAILEDLDIDLYDYPLDYDVQQEGDYYNDGVTPVEDIPWLYAITDISFIPPAGIQYQELERIHVPNLSAVENEAFRITGNPIDYSDCGTTASTSEETPLNSKPIEPNIPQCPEDEHWDYGLRQCVPNNCAEGFYWDGTACVPSPSQVPSPTRTPAGTLTVFDTNLGGTNPHRPLRNVRVVGRRFLKVQRTFTNIQGQFNFSKEFNKVNLLVKFKNDQANIRALRRARLWQMLFPVKIKLGKFKGTLNNLTHEVDYNNNALSRGARHWAAASANNNVQEYYDYAAQLTIGTPPDKLKILLTNWRVQGVAGATPMFAKRVIAELPEDFLRYYVISAYTPLSSFAPWLYVLKTQVDITIGYNLFQRMQTDQTANSDQFGEVAFHELTHAAHYKKVGNAWYNDFVDAELDQILLSSNPPYGTGNAGTKSEIIALGESWAYHMGHFLSDRKYGASSSNVVGQLGFNYSNGSPVSTLSSHLNLLEDFNTDRTNDPDRWIPQGLYYDLIDNRNDFQQAPRRVDIDDQVLDYTNQSCFNALDSDVKSLRSFQTRLLSENANNQAAGVNIIFDFYVR